MNGPIPLNPPTRDPGVAPAGFQTRVAVNLATAMAVMVGAGWATAEPLRPGDWQADPEDAFGGRSAIAEGAMVFWTEEPLAQPAQDSDDQQIVYYQGYVPRTGPYELRATVRLPTVPIVAHDPGADLVPMYGLGVVASGFLRPSVPEELPFLRATVVGADVPEFGVQAGDVLLIWEESEDGPPAFHRMETPATELDLRVVYGGGSEVSFGFRPSGETEWRPLATQAVAPRDGLGARAELLGQAANALVPRGDAGSIRDFEVVFNRPRLRSPKPASGDLGVSTLSWESELGAVYGVWESSDLSAWSRIQGEVVGTGEDVQFLHEPSGPFPRLFYRLSRD